MAWEGGEHKSSSGLCRLREGGTSLIHGGERGPRRPPLSPACLRIVSQPFLDVLAKQVLGPIVSEQQVAGPGQIPFPASRGSLCAGCRRCAFSWLGKVTPCHGAVPEPLSPSAEAPAGVTFMSRLAQPALWSREPFNC